MLGSVAFNVCGPLPGVVDDQGGGVGVLFSAINGQVLYSAINGQPLTSARSA